MAAHDHADDGHDFAQALQRGLDVFNLFNNDNFITPQTTSLLFNFDGTIRSGAGTPRQFQLGVRLVF